MTNKTRERAVNLHLAVASSILSGAPLMVGGMPFVATTDYSAVDAKASVDGEGAFNLSVKGVNDAGNVAVAVGDAIYYVAGDTVKLSKKESGQLFGFALGVVLTSATTVIEVRLAPPNVDGSAGGQLAPIFQSTEITGTGSAQSTAHGLGVIPRVVLAIPTDTSPSTAGVFVVTYGTHTITNAVITVTTSKKYMILAIP